MVTLRALLGLCAVVLLASPAFSYAHGNEGRMVVVISLDGFPAYALEDGRLPIPTLRKLAREGMAADFMEPVNPTVTWPNHTAIVTGVDASEHHVLFNGMLVKPANGEQPSIEPWRDKDLMVHAQTIYDLLFQAGLTTAQVDWVAIYGAKTITWQFPELPDPNGQVEREMIADGTVTAEQLRTFEASSQAWQDQIWTDAAERILREHKPNLLLFHLLTLDDVNHEYSPMSNASFTAFALIDSYVKRIVDLVESKQLGKEVTLFIVSDHGFRAIKHKIHPNVLLRTKGLVTGEKDKTSGKAWVLSTGGTAMVYVTEPADKRELVPQLRILFEESEGIDKVFGPEDISKLGLPSPEATDQGPDLVLAAKPEYSFGNETTGDLVTPATGGTHGYLNSDPKMQSIFIAWGAGIPKGIRLERVSNLDLAPTIAGLFGLTMKKAQGHAIVEHSRHK